VVDTKDGPANKYFCTKCIASTMSDGSLAKGCSRCKFTVSAKNKTCVPYSTKEDFGSNSQNIGGVKHCEGAYEEDSPDPPSCFMCTEGYALVPIAKGYTCEQSQIKLCIVSDKIDGVERCKVCRNGYPSSSYLSCEEKVKQLDPGCLFGMRHPSYNEENPFCSLCERNQALVPKMDPSGKVVWRCVPTSKHNETSSQLCPYGCARCNENNQCVWCNHYNGFYMTDINTCTYTSNILISFGTLLFLLGTTFFATI